MAKQYQHRVGVRAEICFSLILDSPNPTPKELCNAVVKALKKSSDQERGFALSALSDGKVFPEWNSVDPEMEPTRVLSPQSVRSFDCLEILSEANSKVPIAGPRKVLNTQRH